MKEAFKWFVFLACMAALTYQVFFVRPAHAALIVPKVMEFTYKTTAGQTIHVNTWINNGVQCSALTSNWSDSHNELPVSISCVKL